MKSLKKKIKKNKKKISACKSHLTAQPFSGEKSNSESSLIRSVGLP